MRNPDLVPWDYPEYISMINGESLSDSEYDDYVFRSDEEFEYDGDCCRKCYGLGCNYCLTTAF